MFFFRFISLMQLKMCEPEKKRQRINDLLNAETKPVSLFYRIQSKKKIFFFFFFTENELFKKKVGVKDWTKNEKKAFELLSLQRLRRTTKSQ